MESLADTPKENGPGVVEAAVDDAPKENGVEVAPGIAAGATIGATAGVVAEAVLGAVVLERVLKGAAVFETSAGAPRLVDSTEGALPNWNAPVEVTVLFVAESTAAAAGAPIPGGGPKTGAADADAPVAAAETVLVPKAPPVVPAVNPNEGLEAIKEEGTVLFVVPEFDAVLAAAVSTLLGTAIEVGPAGGPTEKVNPDCAGATADGAAAEDDVDDLSVFPNGNEPVSGAAEAVTDGTEGVEMAKGAGAVNENPPLDAAVELAIPAPLIAAAGGTGVGAPKVNPDGPIAAGADGLALAALTPAGAPKVNPPAPMAPFVAAGAGAAAHAGLSPPPPPAPSIATAANRSPQVLHAATSASPFVNTTGKPHLAFGQRIVFSHETHCLAVFVLDTRQ